MNAPEDLLAVTRTIEFELDGKPVRAAEGETILEVADREGVTIPRLCYTPGYRPDGNCRSCMVEIDGERVLAPSCCRAPTQGMKVKATSERAVASMTHVRGLLDAAGALARTLEMDPKEPGALACAGELILEFLYVHNRLSKIITRSGATAYAR